MASHSVNNTLSGEPSKVSGKFHAVKGTVVQAIGKTTSNHSLELHGKEEHTAGVAEGNAAQAKKYASGTSDRIGGKTNAVVGALTGDKTKELSGNIQHEKPGQVVQDANKF